MKRQIIFLLCLLGSIGSIWAQSTQVTGTVISAEDREPIIGASVIVKGTTTGTVTNFDGAFTLTVPDGSNTLIISYIGMRTIEVEAKSILHITMDTDSQNISEVVVTAMGITKEKKALGYAVQDVKSELLTQANSNSLTGALQGKVSGVEITPSSGMPGASAKMVIRGSRSFTGDNTPLYVIDGMPINSTSDWSTESSVSGTDNANRAFDIDPNDIESVNILKGQAASALYGMRASNGVIIITTRSGKGAQKGSLRYPILQMFLLINLPENLRYKLHMLRDQTEYLVHQPLLPGDLKLPIFRTTPHMEEITMDILGNIMFHS